MTIITQILITIVSYFIIMFLSINLLGLLVRGLFTNPELNKEEIKKLKRVNRWLNPVAFLSIIIYLYATFYFLNIGVTLIAGMFMLARLPDLIWEIKNGKKITFKNIPKNVLGYTTTLIYWLALPALYYFMYYF